MTDDLLDEATRLADTLDHLGAGSPDEAAPEDIGEAADALRALVERVQRADAAVGRLKRDVSHRSSVTLDLQLDLEGVTHERDAARGKLDKVREVCDQANKGMPLVTFGGHVQSHRIDVDDVLAILDGKTGD